MAEPGSRPRSRIVVLGGGFAGIYTAMALEKAMDGRDDFEVVLVNKENYFVFQPMLPEVISGTIGMLDVVSPIRRLLPRTDLHVREVESVDLQKRVVVSSPVPSHVRIAADSKGETKKAEAAWVWWCSR